MAPGRERGLLGTARHGNEKRSVGIGVPFHGGYAVGNVAKKAVGSLDYCPTRVSNDDLGILIVVQAGIQGGLMNISPILSLTRRGAVENSQYGEGAPTTPLGLTARALG